MKIHHILIFLATAGTAYATEDLGQKTTQTAKAFPHSWVDDGTEVTCKPAYYRRASDGLLVPVEEARRTGDLMVSGVVLTVVEPQRYAGQVLSFHFDYGPEKWDQWYKPDLLYSGMIPADCIGRLLFLCDPGLTNGLSGTPNPPGGANGRQPSSSVTNQAPPAAASRRSP
jgi:hypothetical protein